MTRIVKPFVIIALLLAPLIAAHAREISIVAPDLLPSFGGDFMGVEAQIISETLAACGNSAKFTLAPYARHWAEYKAGGYDAVASVPETNDLAGAPSIPYYHYLNGATVLAAGGTTINSARDLQGKRIVTFVGATKALPGLAKVIPGLREYREYADQLAHSNLLFSRRVDVVLSDGLIMAAYNQKLRDRVAAGGTLSFDPNQDVVFTPIFPIYPAIMIFRKNTDRDDFNRCFSLLQKSGRVGAIKRAAMEPFRAWLGPQYPED